MKNKFLLLGATALLSTGALIVKAGTTGADITINPRVTMVSAFSLSSQQELNFGKVAWNDGQSLTITASADETNAPAMNIAGNAIYFGGANLGIIGVAGPVTNPYQDKNFELSFPTEIILSVTVGEGDAATDLECGRVSNFNQATVRSGAGVFGGIAYGGTYTVSAGQTKLGSYSKTNNCTGTGIVTFLLPAD